MLAGRAKDTIVLSNGENVEPGPIEDACVASPYIQNLILWGQDHRMLGALVVPDPEAFEQLAAQQGGEAAPSSTWGQGPRPLRGFDRHGRSVQMLRPHRVCCEAAG